MEGRTSPRRQRHVGVERRGQTRILRLLESIESKEVDAVIVWDLDRLVRRPVELEHFFAVADAAGMAKLATIGDNVDPVTGEGVIVARIKGAVAEEVRKNGKRLRRKHLELAEAGRPHGGGNRPFGYERDFMLSRCGARSRLLRVKHSDAPRRGRPVVDRTVME